MWRGLPARYDTAKMAVPPNNKKIIPAVQTPVKQYLSMREKYVY